jgi:hypothetical protein
LAWQEGLLERLAGCSAVLDVWQLPEQRRKAAMTNELLIALGLPLTYLVLSTAVLSGRHQQLPRVLHRLTARNALRWALNR